ncbi:MAG: hypothetical protein CVU91_05780 [Firmicutes bacterium HGW-Firmicutes-16]|nr:MAG: hypothetical protein CVU91_05780 [Firmicutes bacterium HGW-Firmicutes-16]
MAIFSISLSQHMRLAIFTNVSQYVPSLLKLITESNPAMKIRQLSAPRRDIISILLNGEANFAVCNPPIKGNVEIKTLEEITDKTSITTARGYGAREYLTHISSSLASPPDCHRNRRYRFCF